MKSERRNRGLFIRWVAFIVWLGVSVVHAGDGGDPAQDAAGREAALKQMLRALERRCDQLELERDRIREQSREAQWIRTSSAMREHWPADPPPELAWSLNDAGLWMLARGDLDGAHALFEQSLVILERTLEPMHPARGTVLQHLGELRLHLGKPGASDALREAALVFGTATGTDHPRLAAVLNTWAMALAAQGQAEEAESLYRRAIRIYGETSDRHQADQAVPLHNLGVLLLEQGRTDEAGDLLDQALKRLSRGGRESSLVKLAVLRSLARHRRAIGRLDQATQFETQAGDLVAEPQGAAPDAR